MNEPKKRIIRDLTDEQINMLKGNPNVARITRTKIKWSTKFLNDFCAAYDQGIPAPQILRENGIDPQLLGDAKIATFRNYYCHNWKPLHYPTQYDKNLEDKGKKHGGKTNTKLTKLEHDVAFLTQEVEFLKKIFMAGNKHSVQKRRSQKNMQ